MFGAIDASILLELARREGYREQLKFDFPPVVYIRPELVCDVNTGYSFNNHGYFSSQDHPAFAALRDDLERRGYIKTQRSWSNGDHVLKPFYLNEIYFDEGEQFPCGAAMKYTIEFEGKFKHIPCKEYYQEEPIPVDKNQMQLF